MKFLIEIDHSKGGQPPTPEQGRAFIDRFIFPTLARAEELAREGRIVAGGPVAGRAALRLIVEVPSSRHVDELVYALPLATISETRVTPLIEFAERRTQVERVLERLAAS